MEGFKGERKNMDDRIVVVHQPDFMPYVGFFDRLRMADIYVVFDNVQFVASSRGWTNRDKIKIGGRLSENSAGSDVKFW